jgi:hypothetical protein
MNHSGSYVVSRTDPAGKKMPRISGRGQVDEKKKKLERRSSTHANDVKVARRMDRDEIMNRMKVTNVRKTFRTGVEVWTLEA